MIFQVMSIGGGHRCTDGVGVHLYDFTLFTPEKWIMTVLSLYGLWGQLWSYFSRCNIGVNMVYRWCNVTPYGVKWISSD